MRRPTPGSRVQCKDQGPRTALLPVTLIRRMTAVVRPPKTAGTRLQVSVKPKVRTSAGMISDGKSTLAPSSSVERTDGSHFTVNHRKKEGRRPGQKGSWPTRWDQHLCARLVRL